MHELLWKKEETLVRNSRILMPKLPVGNREKRILYKWFRIRGFDEKYIFRFALNKKKIWIGSFGMVYRSKPIRTLKYNIFSNLFCVATILLGQFLSPWNYFSIRHMLTMHHPISLVEIKKKKNNNDNYTNHPATLLSVIHIVYFNRNELNSTGASISILLISKISMSSETSGRKYAGSS